MHVCRHLTDYGDSTMDNVTQTTCKVLYSTSNPKG